MKKLLILFTVLFLSAQLNAVKIQPGTNKRPVSQKPIKRKKNTTSIEIAFESKTEEITQPKKVLLALETVFVKNLKKAEIKKAKKESKQKYDIVIAELQKKQTENKIIEENVQTIKTAIEIYLQSKYHNPIKYVGFYTTLEELLGQYDSLEILLNDLKNDTSTRKHFILGFLNETQIHNIINSKQIKEIFNTALDNVKTELFTPYLNIKKLVKPSKLIKIMKFTNRSLPFIYAVAWTLYLNQDLIPESIMNKLIESPDYLKTFVNNIFLSNEQMDLGLSIAKENSVLALELTKDLGLKSITALQNIFQKIYPQIQNIVQKTFNYAVTKISGNTCIAIDLMPEPQPSFRELVVEKIIDITKETPSFNFTTQCGRFEKLFTSTTQEVAKKSWLIDNPLIRFFAKN